jgi:hypothetical protein
MADAQDWFRFTTTVTATNSNSVSITFQNSQGNLQLALYNSSGVLLGSSQGTGNSEAISLNGRAAGTYYVQVYGNAGATNPNYGLFVNAPTSSPPPPSSTGSFQITLSMSGLSASQQSIFNQAADRWEQIITGDLPNAVYQGVVVDDVLIHARAQAIDGVSGILGQAGPDAFRSGSRLPYHGTMQFDSADMAAMERSGTLLGVVIHEIGHILGIGTIWQSLGLLSGAGTSNPIFTGAQARAAYNQLFGTSASGVPVENTGGPGTRDSHWRESIFRTEIMTGWIGPGTNLPISRVTVASLADIGYQVNYAMADTYSPSSTALATAIQSTGGTSNSARLVGSSSGSYLEQFDGAMMPVRSLRLQTSRWPALDGTRVPIDAGAVDAVMTSAHVRTEEWPFNSLISPSDMEGADTSLDWALESIWEGGAFRDERLWLGSFV